jgi:hypothetical protein
MEGTMRGLLLALLLSASAGTLWMGCDCKGHCQKCDDDEDCCDDRICKSTTEDGRCMDEGEYACVGNRMFEDFEEDE